MNKEKLKEKVTEFPQTSGVYLMKSEKGIVLYVGKAKSLRDRVLSYFSASSGEKVGIMFSQVFDIDYIETDSEVDALLTEARLIKSIQPHYNENLKDDKSYPFLEITTREDYPRVLVTREPNTKNKLYGPFTDVKAFRNSLTILQKIFKFRTCELNISKDDDKRRFNRPCLLYYIKSCTAPCADKISYEEYMESIAELRLLLEGRKKNLINRLKKEMANFSKSMQYEKAAQIRDRIMAINALGKMRLKREYLKADYISIDFQKAQQKLKQLFKLRTTPRVIEGIDVSNISGQEPVGSVVYFIDGKPFKSEYRRYKIRSVKGIDDYAMIREVVMRRYSRLAEEEKVLPDILLIDGGRGHLDSALAALKAIDVHLPLVISIAKREEIIYRGDTGEELRLPHRSLALRLIQYVRDEAHRFALHYHHILRKKKVFRKD